MKAYTYFSYDMDSNAFKNAEKDLIEEIRKIKNQGPVGSDLIPDQPKGLNGSNCNYTDPKLVNFLGNIK